MEHALILFGIAGITLAGFGLVLLILAMMGMFKRGK
jgi:hypothetical protein